MCLLQCCRAEKVLQNAYSGFRQHDIPGIANVCSILCSCLQAEEWYREDAVGRALARASSNGDGGSVQSEEKEDAETDVEAALLSRREVFVTTKLHPRDFDAERSSIMVESSKRNLQVGHDGVAGYGK